MATFCLFTVIPKAFGSECPSAQSEDIVDDLLLDTLILAIILGGAIRRRLSGEGFSFAGRFGWRGFVIILSVGVEISLAASGRFLL